MIDLMEEFGRKYRVDFDQESHAQDVKTMRGRPGGVSTEKAWYYSIPCKYGDISPGNGEDGLIFYCDSVRVANRLEGEMAGKLGLCLIGELDGVIHFRAKYARELFKYARPMGRKGIERGFQAAEAVRGEMSSRMDAEKGGKKRFLRAG
jgi:hypothetical protein